MVAAKTLGEKKNQESRAEFEGKQRRTLPKRVDERYHSPDPSSKGGGKRTRTLGGKRGQIRSSSRVVDQTTHKTRTSGTTAGATSGSSGIQITKRGKFGAFKRLSAIRERETTNRTESGASVFNPRPGRGTRRKSGLREKKDL